MNILITQSVTAGAEIFKDIGHLHFIADNDLEHADLNDIDAIIMRSQSRVTVEQVEGTKVKFIGSATAGFDHLPIEALSALGVQVANAPGCNANSVADYWLSALCVVSMSPSDRSDLFMASNEACRATPCGFQDFNTAVLQYPESVITHEQPFHGKTLGIVGYGEVGQRVAKRAAALGFRVIVNDPPRFVGAKHFSPGLGLSESHAPTQLADIPYSIFSLPDLFSQADIISLHVPLTTTGPWPTTHLIHAELLAKLKPGATLINTARGEVCDAQALIDAKNQGLIADLILDVWPHEPHVSLALWQAATIATPHIAGHSYLAKWQGTWQVYQALLQYLGKLGIAQHVKPTGAPPAFYQTEVGEKLPRLLRDSRNDSELLGLWHYIQQIYDVTKDHDAMRAWLTLPQSDRIKAFKDYRRDYPRRSELCLATVSAHALTLWQREVLLSAGVTLN